MSLLDDIGGLLSGTTNASALPGFLGASLIDLASIAGQCAIAPENRPILILVLNEMIPVWGHWFFPKPEDLTYSQPVRATPIQTLGGAYVDDFGEGIREITCYGRSSYKHGPLDALLGLDEKQKKRPCKEGKLRAECLQGEIWIKNLKDGLIRNFHRDREQNARQGLDPDLYQMFFVDVMNFELWRVFPLSFVLRRNKQSPLLIQYQMRFIGLERVI